MDDGGDSDGSSVFRPDKKNLIFQCTICLFPKKKITPEKGPILSANINIIPAGVKYRVSALYLRIFFRDPSFEMLIVPHRATVAASGIRE